MPKLILLEIEVLALAGALALAVLAPRRAARRLHPIARAFARLGARHRLAIMLCFAAGLAGSALLAAAYPTEPRVHDEWSYVLAADTFASGRLTNPPHPHWEHFESFHILSRPSYQSKYPPAPGLALALGQVLTGNAQVGTWIALGLACAATCWMLQAYVPARFALLGGLLPLLRLGIFEQGGLFAYWSRSYWGGAVAMLGGALVYGAVPRLVRRPRARDAVWLALGLALLANSRPWEGLLASTPALAVLGGWLGSQLLRGDPARRAALTRAALPLAGALALTGAAMGVYHDRVTGDPFKLPYQLYEDTYSAGIQRFFTGDKDVSTRVYRNPQMRAYYQDSAPEDFEVEDPLRALASRLEYHVTTLWAFFAGPALSLPIAFAALALRDRWTWLALAGCGLIVLQISIVSWFFIHYAAPAAALVYLLAVQGLRRLRVLRVRGRRVGRDAVRAVIAVCLLFFALAVVDFARDMRSEPPAWNYQRAEVRERLLREPGRDLVFVRYGPGHRVHYEWVYNAADIDASPIVWARELEPEPNRRLRRYFDDRRVWIVHADADPPRLEPVP